MRRWEQSWASEFRELVWWVSSYRRALVCETWGWSLPPRKSCIVERLAWVSSLMSQVYVRWCCSQSQDDAAPASRSVAGSWRKGTQWGRLMCLVGNCESRRRSSQVSESVEGCTSVIELVQSEDSPTLFGWSHILGHPNCVHHWTYLEWRLYMCSEQSGMASLIITCLVYVFVHRYIWASSYAKVTRLQSEDSFSMSTITLDCVF
jgi:hypothetical protein